VQRSSSQGAWPQAHSRTWRCSRNSRTTAVEDADQQQTLFKCNASINLQAIAPTLYCLLLHYAQPSEVERRKQSYGLVLACPSIEERTLGQPACCCFMQTPLCTAMQPALLELQPHKKAWHSLLPEHTCNLLWLMPKAHALEGDLQLKHRQHGHLLPRLDLGPVSTLPQCADHIGLQHPRHNTARQITHSIIDPGLCWD